MNNIKITYGREDLLSRIPGLFPYLEYDEFGVCHLHKSTDSNNGCYGKMVPAIHVPNGISLVIDENEIIKENTVYSYRTLLNYYYKYKELSSNSFIQFFREGIGSFNIPHNDGWDLVPESEYYANAGRIHEEYCRIKKVCDNYLQMKPISGQNCNLECLVEKYRRMGGDEMKDFYYDKYNESLIKSEFYFQTGDIENTYFNFNLSIVTNDNDLGVRSCYEIEWEPGAEYHMGEIVIFEGRSYVCTYDNSGLWDNIIEEYVFNPDWFDLIGDENSGTVTLLGTTDSKLKSFRCGRSYNSIDGTREEPESGKDWLWYYKVGTISHYESVTDEYGNIETKDGNRGVVGSVHNNLLAYGNIITDINVDSEEHTITFTYVIGANLKATLAYSELIDENSQNTDKKYFYENFQYNEDDIEHGLVFTETYPYEEGGQLDLFYTLNPSLFDYYIGKTGGNRESEMAVYNSELESSYKYSKCEFDISRNECMSSTEVNGEEFDYSYVKGSYIVNANSNSEILSVPTFKEESYIGITYNPRIDNDVYVNRGNAASWERHMKLGEIKSFDDLENYANGGFFNIR